MDRKTIEEIFKLGSDALYNTLNPDNGEVSDRYLELKEDAVKLFSIHIVSGCYYSVKLMTDDEYEPALATYLHGGICFQFFNGVVVSVDKVNGYKELNYR